MGQLSDRLDEALSHGRRPGDQALCRDEALREQVAKRRGPLGALDVDELVVRAMHKRFGEYLRYGGLVSLSECEGVFRGAVVRGEQTRVLLAELGYPSAEVEDLLARGVVYEGG